MLLLGTDGGKLGLLRGAFSYTGDKTMSLRRVAVVTQSQKAINVHVHK
jgi:hypothetical protein